MRSIPDQVLTRVIDNLLAEEPILHDLSRKALPLVTEYLERGQVPPQSLRLEHHCNIEKNWEESRRLMLLDPEEMSTTLDPEPSKIESISTSPSASEGNVPSQAQATSELHASVTPTSPSTSGEKPLPNSGSPLASPQNVEEDSEPERALSSSESASPAPSRANSVRENTEPSQTQLSRRSSLESKCSQESALIREILNASPPQSTLD